LIQSRFDFKFAIEYFDGLFVALHEICTARKFATSTHVNMLAQDAPHLIDRFGMGLGRVAGANVFLSPRPPI
jgi:hypothetical protein